MTFKELGEELRQTRLAKNWRPRDISRRTRIQLDYIRKLESGDFTFMPDPIIRGFIKAFARDVGLNQNEMIDKFDQAILQEKKQEEEQRERQQAELERKDEKAASGGKKEKKSEEKTKSTEKEKVTSKSEKQVSKTPNREETTDVKTQGWLQKYRSEIILGLLFILILAAIVYIYLQFGNDLFSSNDKPVDKITVFEARKDNLEKEAAYEPEVKPIRIPDSVKLRFVASESTWVRMIIDATDTSEYIYAPGASRSIEAQKSIEMRMGRADGLLLWVNQDSIGKLGSASEIVNRFIVTPEGIKEKRIRHPVTTSQPAENDSL